MYTIYKMGQLNLPFLCDEQSLQSYFEKTTGKSVSLTPTENTSSMIAIRTRGRSVFLRLHRIFLSADINVLEEITGMIKSKKGKTPHIIRFIKNNSAHIKKKPKRLKIITEGRFYDLLEISTSLNKEYFNNMVSVQITWGSRNPRRAVTKRVLGSYLKNDGLIRINPVLDSKKVPGYYIQYVVYHEMLHADMDGKTEEDKVHSKEFKRREKLFRHYEKALALEKKKQGT